MQSKRELGQGVSINNQGNLQFDQATIAETSKEINEFWAPERLQNVVSTQLTLPEGMFKPTALTPAQINYASYAPPITNVGTTQGKVYFTHATTGKVDSCSGVAMNSNSKRIVATAAHCVHTGPGGGGLHQGWTFIPNYDHGQQPYGNFSFAAAFIPSAWSAYGANNVVGLSADIAFVVTNVNANGVKLGDAVGGGQNIWAWGGSPAFDASIFGYPVTLNYGQTLQTCSGSTYPSESQFQGTTYTFHSIDGCNFGGGASGGAWLDWYNNETSVGFLRSISSFVSGNTLYGPVFSDDIVNLYNIVANSSF